MVFLEEKYQRLLEFTEAKKKDKILVVGTGVFPKIEFFLFKRGIKNIISGDIDEKNLETGRKILPKIKFVFLDAQKKFPFKNQQFDKVVFTEVLEHLKDENLVLKEIKRVLKKSGRLVISVPKKRWFNEVFSPITRFQHKREYTEERMEKILEKNGFKINKKFVGGSFYELLNIWIHLILKYLLLNTHIDPFFKKKMDNGYKKSFKGKGTIIIFLVKKI